MPDCYYKKNSNDIIWWKDMSKYTGRFIFSFDKKIDFNLFRDYPKNLTAEQKAIFDKENPQWTEFFKGRT